MARQVRILAGEGPAAAEVGIADIEQINNGDQMVRLTITNPAIITLLGGEVIQGVIPGKIVDSIPEEDNSASS